VLHELGAEVIAMGIEPDGLNINEGVGSTHPELLQQRVVAEQADLGIALDGDADRVVMVDAGGRLVDGDDILYIIARNRQAAGMLRGPVVGTVMTNLGLELALRRAGIGLERTRVGDRYILERLVQENWVLGGEPSGHIICRDRTTSGDGTISALQVLCEMVRSGRSLADLCAEVEKCPQVLVNVGLGDQRPAAVMAAGPVLEAVKDAEADLGNQGRVLLRPSGTEPLIRVMVEGTDAAAVDRLAHRLADGVRQFLGASAG